MNQQVKDKLCKNIDAELEKISAMPSLTDVALGNLYKLIEVKKGILKIEMLEGESEENYGNSYRSYPRMGYSNHYPSEPVYGGYSMDGNSAYAHMEEAMRLARSDREREAIRQAMSKM